MHPLANTKDLVLTVINCGCICTQDEKETLRGIWLESLVI